MDVQNAGKELCHLGRWENKGSNYHFSQHSFASLCVQSFPGTSSFISKETEQVGGIRRNLKTERRKPKGVIYSLKSPLTHLTRLRSRCGLCCWDNWQSNTEDCFVPALKMAQWFWLIYLFIYLLLFGNDLRKWIIRTLSWKQMQNPGTNQFATVRLNRLWLL